MNLRTYQAFTMAQALAAVKRDLGASAVILNTRTFRRWRFPALWKRTIVEVTATIPQPQAVGGAGKMKTSATRPAPASAGAARKAYSPQTNVKVAPVGAAAVTLGAVSAPAVSAMVEAAPSSLEQDQLRTRRLAMAMMEQLSRQKAATDAANANAAATAMATPSPPVAVVAKANENVVTNPVVQTLPAARRYILNEPGRARQSVATESAVNLANSKSMQEELSAIRSMVGQVLAKQESSNDGEATRELPQQLMEMYLRLIGQDLSEDLADDVVRSVRDELDEAQLDDEHEVRAAVGRHLAKIIPVANDAMFEPKANGRPTVIAMVGPTGVGKTTTLAKLAATYKLRHNLRVGLITADTYRIAAVEQLRTYANIIGLPLEVVLTPAEMGEAIEKLSRGSDEAAACDVILVDTAGRSQNDTGRIDELCEFVNAARPDQVHLVLSSTAGERVLLKEAEAFSPLGIHRIVLTKLDEAVSFGMLINVVRKVGKQLSFVTTGQEVPEHLEAGRADRLAELVMGGTLRS